LLSVYLNATEKILLSCSYRAAVRSFLQIKGKFFHIALFPFS